MYGKLGTEKSAKQKTHGYQQCHGYVHIAAFIILVGREKPNRRYHGRKRGALCLMLIKIHEQHHGWYHDDPAADADQPAENPATKTNYGCYPVHVHL